jgi:fused signal recognition particle receptor
VLNTVIVVVVLVVLAGVVASLTLLRGRGKTPLPPLPKDAPPTDQTRDLPSGVTVLEPDTAPAPEPEAPPELVEPEVEAPEPTAGRLGRLRGRLSRSQSTLGRGLLALLSRDKLDDATWEEIEDSLLTADVGVGATQELVGRLRARVEALKERGPDDVRRALRAELLETIGPDTDRSLATAQEGRPAVVLVVGVNGTGKTTTVGKLARVLVADGRTVLLGAADTFRAAAADQLATWAGRVGAEVVRGPEGADPASVAFDAVRRGIDTGVDTVLIDTAGRLQNKVGLMDELGKVKRVVEKLGPVDETLLVLDATTGQNGLEQARKFTETSGVTGIVLTKLDGTAKGGIVVAIARELNLPIRYIGVGEKVDDLLPFDSEKFIESLFEK